MKQLLDLFRLIKEKGNESPDRTGTGTKSIFSHEMRFDLRNNKLPLATTKKVFTRGIIEELFFFIAGDTNNKTLTDKNVHIWDSWAVPEDVTVEVPKQAFELAQELSIKLGLSIDDTISKLMDADKQSLTDDPTLQQPDGGIKLVIENDIKLTRTVVTTPAGSLGPVYGEMWRRWPTPEGRVIDQLADLIKGLKERPHSRRHIVTAWNPALLPDETKSPQQNVIDGKMCLAACHCMFQMYTRRLALNERIDLLDKVWSEHGATNNLDFTDEILDGYNVPRLALSCKLTQRSADTALGVPFNIASYAILTRMIAQVVGMAVDELIWSGGDCHIYNNQWEGIDEQLTREPRELPTLWLNPDIKNIEDFTYDDFCIDGYDPHPAIKFPGAAV